MSQPSDRQIASWYPRLFRTALRMTGSLDDAADLTQQVFYKALSRWDQFDGRCRETTWLHSILVNCVRDHFRRKDGRVNEVSDDWALARLIDHMPNSEEQVERNEKLVWLGNVIEKLPDTLRWAFVATVLDGYSYRQAAELLSVPVGTVASRVYEARQRINGEMQRKFREA